MAFHRDSGSGGKRGGQRFGGPKRSFGARKSFGSDFDGPRPTMHSATCAECGNRCQVPFKPNGSKPVLCSNCFGNDDHSGSKSYAPKQFDEKPRRLNDGDANIGYMLKEISGKLDLIIQALKK